MSVKETKEAGSRYVMTKWKPNGSRKQHASRRTWQGRERKERFEFKQLFKAALAFDVETGEMMNTNNKALENVCGNEFCILLNHWKWKE